MYCTRSFEAKWENNLRSTSLSQIGDNLLEELLATEHIEYNGSNTKVSLDISHIGVVSRFAGPQSDSRWATLGNGAIVFAEVCALLSHRLLK